jgi:hypothetical protein
MLLFFRRLPRRQPLPEANPAPWRRLSGPGRGGHGCDGRPPPWQRLSAACTMMGSLHHF